MQAEPLPDHETARGLGADLLEKSDQGKFYLDAKVALGEGVFDQKLEDELDLLMQALEEEDDLEEAAIEAELFGADATAAAAAKPEVTPSEFTEFSIRIPQGGNYVPFSFAGRRYLRAPYDTSARRTLLKCGRQTEKSTMLGNKSLAYCSINGSFKVLYVSATATQAQVFSVDRLKDPVETSEQLRKLTSTALSQNVFFKQFKNRSQIRIRYAFLNADRTRGIPADLVLIDEIQDIHFHNVPIIEQCASHSPWKLFCYSGTPKSLDNTIEIYWSEHSTQNEWAVPCDRHSPYFWNFLGRQNVGKTGPICARCGKPINPNHPDAAWVSFQPVTDENAHRVTFEGYRINQLMVPWIINNPDAWHDSIIFPLENYGTAQFNNEVLGLSFDSGQRPLTRQHIEACCQERIHMEDVLENARKCREHGGVAAGIDWGSGENESYTVLTLGGYMGGEFQIFYCHRFVAEDLNPRLQLLKIAQLLNDVQFHICGADYGGGFDRNDWLMRNFGPTKLFKYQYAGAPKKKVKWESDLGRFMLHRTEIMSDLFNAIRNRRIWLPRFEEIRHLYGADMLNIFSEYNRQIHMTQYKVSPGKSDDTFHSILYCLLASMFIKPRPDLIIPVKANNVDFTPDLAA